MLFSRVLYQLSYLGVNPIVSAARIGGNRRRFGGRLLVSASIRDMWVREGNEVRLAPAALSVFRIGADGKLTFVRKVDVELNGKLQWWTEMMGLPA